MKHNYTYTLILCLLLAFAACQTEDLQQHDLCLAAQDTCCSITLGTRGGLLDGGTGTEYQNTTYRAQLFYRDYAFPRLDSLRSPYVGTYCNPKGTNTWLTPCAVDANYAFTTEGSQYGLRAGMNHKYYLVLNSPAVDYVKYAEVIKTNIYNPSQTTTMEYYGLNYKRSGNDAKDHPAVSTAAKVTTTGLNLEASYLYELDDSMMLKEYRSRVAYSVRCGDAISHANLKKLEIKGLRKNAIFRPIRNDFFFVENAVNYEDVVVYECPVATGLHLERGGTEGAYTEGESQSLTGATTATHLDDTQTNTYFTYILSDDYKSLDAANKYIKTPANLCITLCSDDGSPIVIDPIPMAFIFKPQTSYFYMITINSVYLSISVTSKSWSTPIAVGEEVDDPDPIHLTINIADWTGRSNSATMEPGSGGEGEKYDKRTDGVASDNWNTPSGGSGSIDEN